MSSLYFSDITLLCARVQVLSTGQKGFVTQCTAPSEVVVELDDGGETVLQVNEITRLSIG